jgi:hypothetical protein
VSLIRESERGVKTLTIVDRDQQTAIDVAHRLAEQGVTAPDTKPVHNGFDYWVRQGGLNAFMQEMTDQPF